MANIGIIGGGFTGVTAAYELLRHGHSVSLFEREQTLGGLAGVFEIEPGIFLEKFYHHWFTTDIDALNFVRELGLEGKLHSRATNTGLYFANSIFRLSSPWDLLRFTPISLLSRIRVGLMVLRARAISDYSKLEQISAEDWIRKYAGREAFETIWGPLLRGKFGVEAANVSAVWFWNKLKLRGSSRGEKAEERLYYLEGGFQTLLNTLESTIRHLQGTIHFGAAVQNIQSSGSEVVVQTQEGTKRFDAVLVTTPLPTFLSITSGLPEEYRARLSAIRTLGNVCLVLALRESLSNIYWLNVTDPTFPFVGVIEHTNFEPPPTYAGKHIVYLSKYLPTNEHLYQLPDEELVEFAIPHLQKMFPQFRKDWILESWVWREPYSQPVVVKNYSQLIPEIATPLPNIYLSTMAQVYPEDRGTSYAIRGGKRAAAEILKRL